MLFLATFFPSGPDDEELEVGGEGPAGHVNELQELDFVTEFLKLTVDLGDLVGLYLVMQRFVAGKGAVKILIAGVGWAFAEFLLTRVIFLWVGARGIEFDWKYIQKSLDTNVSLVHYLTLATLVWLYSRRDALVVPGGSSAGGSGGGGIGPLLLVLMAVCSYKT